MIDFGTAKATAAAMLAMLVSVTPVTASAISLQTFDTDVTRAATQAPGVWYTDRYAPAGFEGGVDFDGDKRLRHSISAADGAASRPSSFGSTFYNTQGRKFDTPGATALSIDLYIPEDWESTNRRMAGIWGVGLNAADTISLYPIIEFTSDGGNPRFRVWPVDAYAGGWIDLGLPTGFVYNSWTTLEMVLDTDVTFHVGDLSQTFGANGSVSFGNVILQGYNTDEGVGYDIYWDNFRATVIPLPAAGWLLITAMGGLTGLGWSRRRRAAA